MKNYTFIALITLIILHFLLNDGVYAQTPIDVQLLTSNGEHYKSVISYEKLAKRKVTTESKIAYGRSCWALGLVSKAVVAFDEALQDDTLPDIEKARLYLSRGIIEFQESNYQLAALFGEKAYSAVKISGPLRAKTLLLAGQSNAKLGNYGVAEAKLNAALKDGSESDIPEILFQLGEAKLYLNQLEEARKIFESIPVQYDRTPYVIRRLSEVSLAQGDTKRAAFWLAKGRSDYQDSFLDSWVDYALIQSAIGENDIEQIRKIRGEANARYAPSDYWLALLNASAEVYEWKQVVASREKLNG